MTEPIVSAELHIGNLSDKFARDILRRAAAEAKHGPVWLVNKAGERIGAIVTREAAEMLAAGAVRHADHDAELACRPALGNGLCYPLSTDGGDR